MPFHVVPAGVDKLIPLFATLDRECAAYCVLAGYETLPEQAVSNIDFMVSASDFEKLPQILSAFAAVNSMFLMQYVQHEISARCYVLSSINNNSVTFLQANSASDYRRHSRIWMKATDVLSRRRLHPKGFWIPSATDAFTYYLIKCVNKRELDQQHGDYLSKLYAEDPQGCNAALSKQWPHISAQMISAAAASGVWVPVIREVSCLADELLASPPLYSDKARGLKELGRKISRFIYPTGFFIAFLGPDGVGKSTAINTIEAAFKHGFSKTTRFYLRPKLLKGTAASNQFAPDPHAKPSRDAVTSVIKIAYFVADYVLSYWTIVRPMMVRSTFILFDRYFYDLSVDSRRYRYGGPAWLPRFAARFVPAPDLVLVFDAPADIVHKRKQELPYAEIERQRELFLRFARNSSYVDVVLIDATASPEEVCAQCSRELLRQLEKRARKRLRVNI